MKKSAIIIVIIIGLLFAGFYWVYKIGKIERGNPEIIGEIALPQPKTFSNMIITSPSFKDGEFIPKKFTCDGFDKLPSNSLGTGTTGGGDINPELQIQNVPAEAKSLALIMHDPDAPMAGGFTHWLVWNIAASSEASLAPAGRDPFLVIKEESVPPQSAEGQNDRRKIGYTGPCPPSGIHHYHFKLYALDAMLNLKSGESKDALETEINKHLIVQAELIGLYQRK